MKTAVKQNASKSQTSVAAKTAEKKADKTNVDKMVVKATSNLETRILSFEKLRGLANQRERLTQTLTELTKFNYNQDDSSSFHIRDSKNLEFKTTNTNLIKLVTEHLQLTLEARKNQIEQEILAFEL